MTLFLTGSGAHEHIAFILLLLQVARLCVFAPSRPKSYHVPHTRKEETRVETGNTESREWRSGGKPHPSPSHSVNTNYRTGNPSDNTPGVPFEEEGLAMETIGR